jgi:hypothetical protein
VKAITVDTDFHKQIRAETVALRQEAAFSKPCLDNMDVLLGMKLLPPRSNFNRLQNNMRWQRNA